MPVPMRPQAAERIVRVDRADAREADDAVEGPQRRRVGLGRPDVVSGGEDVARVEADGRALAPLDAVDDLRQVLEAGAERFSGAGGGFEEDEGGRGGRGVERAIDAVGDAGRG